MTVPSEQHAQEYCSTLQTIAVIPVAVPAKEFDGIFNPLHFPTPTGRAPPLAGRKDASTKHRIQVVKLLRGRPRLLAHESVLIGQRHSVFSVEDEVSIRDSMTNVVCHGMFSK